MPTERISMKKIKEILRLKYGAELSHRQIGKSLCISPGSVSRYVNDAKSCGFTWPIPDDISDEELERLIYSDVSTAAKRYTAPDWDMIYLELKKKGVTKQLLWQEYRQLHGSKAYSYSQFCSHFKTWLKNQKLSMRQFHQAGEKLFVDFAGQTVPINEAKTGQVQHAQIFIAVLGASNYTYAQAVWTQQLPDWIMSHVNAFNYFGGVTEIVVPDNLKSAISKTCRYDPDINPSYQQLASYYNFAVIPARPYRPKDKAKVEVGVQIVERWVLAKLRHQQFFSLKELNQSIQVLLKELNEKPFQKLPGSRRTAFLQLDKPALKSLPKQPYQYTEIKTARVHVDYHIEVDGHYYSVPFKLIRKQVDVHIKGTALSVFYQGKRVATHPKSHMKGHHTTLTEHMPSSHKSYLNWNPGRFLDWANKIGPQTVNVIQGLLQKRQHPEQGYRSCFGVLNLSKRYGDARLEAACTRALNIGAPYRKNIESILKHGLDKLEKQNQSDVQKALDHDNVRGAKYYH